MVRVNIPEKPFNKQLFEEFCQQKKFVFPEDFVNFLVKYNDADLEPNIIYGFENDYFVRYFYGTSGEPYSDISLVYEDYIGRIPLNCVPIADPDFGNQICISLAKDTYGKIYFWDHETMDNDEDETKCKISIEDMICLADSFKDLLCRIQNSPYV